MHTASQLQADIFRIESNGNTISLDTLFANWNLHDRVGVLITEPFGSLGASLLIQAAIARYFDYRRENSALFQALLDQEGERESLQGVPKGFGSDPMAKLANTAVVSPGYADIYVLHVGQRYGDHMGMDIWPPNREILVARDLESITVALADLGITRLVIPDAPVGSGAVDWEIRAVLRERITDVFVYGANGHVSGADLTMTGISPVSEQNPTMMLHMHDSVKAVESAGDSKNPEGTARTVARIKARLDEVAEEKRLEIIRDRTASLVDGNRVEQYRRATLQQGFDILDGLVRAPV